MGDSELCHHSLSLTHSGALWVPASAPGVLHKTKVGPLSCSSETRQLHAPAAARTPPASRVLQRPSGLKEVTGEESVRVWWLKGPQIL